MCLSDWSSDVCSSDLGLMSCPGARRARTTTRSRRRYEPVSLRSLGRRAGRVAAHTRELGQARHVDLPGGRRRRLRRPARVLRRDAGHERRLAEPILRPRDHPARRDDLPPYLLERHNGQGARVAGEGRPDEVSDLSLPHGARRRDLREPPGLRVVEADPRGAPHQRQSVGRLALRHVLLSRHRIPRAARHRGRDLPRVDHPVRHEPPRAPGELQRGRDHRALLALRRPRLDHGVHLHVSHLRGGEAMAAAEHKHPNYMAIFWYLAILTVVEIAVIYAPLPKVTIVVLLCSLALGKAVLVAMYFMHLRFETRTLGLVAITPLMIATLLVFLLLPDGLAVAKRTVGVKAAVSAPPKHCVAQARKSRVVHGA